MQQLAWGTAWQKSKKPLRTGWLITAGLVALYFGTVRLHDGRGIASEKGIGLAAPQWEPISLWQQSPYERVLDAGQREVSKVSMIAGGAGDAPPNRPAMKSSIPASLPPAADAARKLARNSSMEVGTKDPADTADT